MNTLVVRQCIWMATLEQNESHLESKKHMILFYDMGSLAPNLLVTFECVDVGPSILNAVESRTLKSNFFVEV